MFVDYLKQYRENITDRDPNTGICFDGAVNETEFFKRNKRLVFLLKETNGNKNNGECNEINTDWNYMEWVQSQASMYEPLYRSVFRNIAMWSKMFELYTRGKKPNIVDFIDSNGLIVNKDLCRALEGTAILNLKKSWGTGQTNWNDMKSYLEGDVIREEILIHQMDILKPTIVLCAGTFDFAQKIFGKTAEAEMKKGCYGNSVEFFKRDEVVFVKCYHPSRPGWSRESSYMHMDNIFSVFCKSQL